VVTGLLSAHGVARKTGCGVETWLMSGACFTVFLLRATVGRRAKTWMTDRRVFAEVALQRASRRRPLRVLFSARCNLAIPINLIILGWGGREAMIKDPHDLARPPRRCSFPRA